MILLPPDNKRVAQGIWISAGLLLIACIAVAGAYCGVLAPHGISRIEWFERSGVVLAVFSLLAGRQLAPLSLAECSKKKCAVAVLSGISFWLAILGALIPAFGGFFVR